MTSRRSKGEGTIVQRTDGRWSATFTVEDPVTGKKKRKALYGRTRPEAVAKLNAALRDREAGRQVDPSKITLGAYLDQWLEDSARPSVRPKTFEDYKYLVHKYITPALGQVQLQKLTPQQVQRFLNSQSAAGLSPRTVQFLRAILRRALAVAVRWNLVVHNAVILTDPPASRRPERRILSPQDARGLLASTGGDRLGPLYLTAIALGLRKGEVLALRWVDVDWDAGTLRVEGSLQRVEGRLQRLDPKTSTSRRVVVMPKSVSAALRGHRVRQAEERLAAGPKWREHGLVFTTTIGTAIEPRNLSRSFSKALEVAGLPRVSFHSLRHLTCSLLLGQGLPVKAVSELLGHADVSITLRYYTHSFEGAKRTLAAEMDLLLGAG